MKQTYVQVETGDKLTYNVFPNPTAASYRVFDYLGYFDKELKKDGQPNRTFRGQALGVYRSNNQFGLPFNGWYGLFDESREAKAKVYRDEISRLQGLIREAKVSLYNLYAEDKK